MCDVRDCILLEWLSEVTPWVGGMILPLSSAAGFADWPQPAPDKQLILSDEVTAATSHKPL
jgi:hypothetical protein